MPDGSPSRTRIEQASVRAYPATRQYGSSNTKDAPTVSVTPTAAPRMNTTLRRTRRRKTCKGGRTATSTWITARAASGRGSFPAVLPSRAPIPINRSHRPSTTPRTISSPENAPSNPRINASSVITHETPSAPTASRTSLWRSGTGVLFLKAFDVVNGDGNILAPPGGGFATGLLRKMIQELGLVGNLRPDLRKKCRRAGADV